MSDQPPVSPYAAPDTVATRDGFLRGIRRRYRNVKLPGSEITVRIQSLTEGEMVAIEMDAFERDPYTKELRRDEEGNLLRTEAGISESRIRMIIATLVDDAGNLLLSPNDAEQVRQIDAADTIALYKVVEEHCRLSSRHDNAAKKN